MIIFINGTISSGKSTIAKLLEKEIPNTVVLEIDILRNLVHWMPLEKTIPINLENAISLITNFVNRKINIVVPYPLSQKNYDYLMENLKKLDVKILTITLVPDPEVLLKGERGRKLDNWEKERIKHHTKIGLTKPTFGNIINNTNQTPEETVKIILDLLNNK